MKILGITAEYNPLHNGHVYQMSEANKNINPDYCVVVMSGNFTQRGEPAIADKWIRARQIVDAKRKVGTGADVVVEMPFAFACNRAEHFAAGGVDTLVMMGANYISFGCETDEPELLEELAGKLIEEKEAIEEKTLEIMKNGFSRAKAYQTAVALLLGGTMAKLMEQPNNILAIEYYKRIAYWNAKGRKIEAVPVVRKGSTYNGVENLEQNSGFAGASQIRDMIAEGADISRFVPSPTQYEKLADVHYRLFMMLKAIIVRSQPEELAEIYCVGEGLHYKMKYEINDSYSLEEFMERLVSRRYTKAAIRRILTYVLLGIHKEEMDSITASEITFARILAVGAEGRNLIRRLKAENVEIITNINKEKPAEEMARKSLDLLVRSSDVYNMLCGKDMYNFSDRVMKPYIEI